MDVSELIFRKATEADIDYLLWLREVTMNQHIGNSGLPTTREKHLERIKYEFDNAKIILINEQKIGLIKVVERSTYTEIIQIQIDPSHQGQGIGHGILKSIIAKSIDSNLPVVLSVLKKNNAISLYKRMGFQIIEEKDVSFTMKIGDS